MYKDFSTPKMFWVKKFYEIFRNKNKHSGVTIHLTPTIIANIRY